MKMRLYLTAALACLAIAMGWVAGCGSKSSPTGPTDYRGLPRGVTALTVKGNAALTAPGQTTQLTLEATLSDGSTTDMTSTTQWFSSNTNVVTVSAAGLAMAVDFGKASVRGSTIIGYGQIGSTGAGAELVMTVLPEGTYILSGSVTEAGNLPVAGARVETIGGPMSGRVATTNGAGNYAFNAVSGVVQVRATKDQYQPTTQNVSQNTEHTDVELMPSAPYASIGGIYSLTFTASPSCNLPDDAMKRTYTATIDQRGAPLTVFLSGARFFTSNSRSTDQFSGRVLGNVVSLTLDVADNCFYYGDYGGCVVEQLADNRYVTLTGTARAVVTTPAELSAVFAGAVSVSGDGNGSQPIAACSAPDHQLEFKRTAGTSSKRF